MILYFYTGKYVKDMIANDDKVQSAQIVTK